MNKTPFGLKVAGVALILASSIAAVVVVAQRPGVSTPTATALDKTAQEAKVSHK
jgi:hypothetical protein